MKKISILAVFLLSLSAYSQYDLKGKVLDKQSNEALVGATLTIEGSQKGVATDFNGDFSIAITGTETLVVSYMGYKTQKVPVNNRKKLTIYLQSDKNALDEVVIVGYGQQKKSDLTGAVSVVKMKDVTNQQVATLDQALQGNVAGIDVTSNSGSPGSGVMMRIRGIGTINNSEPLYVVDGMMVEDVDFLNMDDIASIQVLKDASATAIYGSKGANGVVIIKTKSGSKNKSATIQYSTSMGFQNFWRSTNVMDAPTWAKLKNEAAVAAGKVPPVPNPDDLQTTNWLDAVAHKNAPMTQHDLSISGGNEKSKYYFSAGYLKQDGIINKTSFERISLRVNSDYQVKPWLKIGENLALVRPRYQNIEEQDEWTSILITAIAADPSIPVKNPDGSFASGVYNNETWNPAAILEYTHQNDLVYRTLGNIYLDFNLYKNLSFKTTFGMEYAFGKTTNFNPKYYVSAQQQNNVSKYLLNNSHRLLKQWTNTFNYKGHYKNHNFEAILGGEMYSYDYEDNGISVNGMPNEEAIQYINNATGSNAATVWGGKTEVRQLSIFSRLNYNYLDKYLATINFRADASSKFPKKNYWGYFPSFSLGWIISKENFMKKFEFINQLKLRAGWGQVGNEGSLAPYQDVTTASPGANYLFGGHLAPGIAFPGAGNDELKWETTTTTNVGLDFGLLKNKISGTLDYFIKNTTGMILQVPVPGQTGIQNPPYQNAGSMKNNGFELSLNYKNYDHKLKYAFGLVFSKINNEVTSLGTESGNIPGAEFMNSYYVTNTIAGQPMAQFYGYKTDGLFQNQAEIDAQTAQTNVAPGDVRYVDADGDGELDLYYLGSPLPDYTFGFNTKLKYQKFDFSFQIQGVQGNKIFNGTSFYKLSSTAKWNLGRDMVNRWTGEGTQNNARYPRLNADDVNNALMSDRFIEDGSYIRFKNLQVGYTFSIPYIKMKSVYVFVRGQNLLTFTKYSGMDPEIGMRDYDSFDIGVDRGFYPTPRIYSFGFKAKF